MASGFAGFLKRWRGNYYVSVVLAFVAKPLHFLLTRTALNLERRVQRNGVTIRLPNGQKMSIVKNSGIGIASLLFWHGLDGYEPETSRTLRFLFEHAAKFVDVGANFGLYSVLGVLWNSNLDVIAFEPVPIIFSNLKRNVLVNRLESRVRCENVALSSKSGTAAFFLPRSEGLDIETTGTLASESWQSRKGSPIIEVKTVRFDDYEASNTMHVDLIKIDVEDFEADVLEGMLRVINRDRPFIVCEVLPRPHRNERTYRIVETLKYQIYWITPLGHIKVPKFDFARGSFRDFLLSPVSTPDVVLDDLNVLWDLRKRSTKMN
jgi:FkbM family methyltransferase